MKNLKEIFSLIIDRLVELFWEIMGYLVIGILAILLYIFPAGVLIYGLIFRTGDFLWIFGSYALIVYIMFLLAKKFW